MKTLKRKGHALLTVVGMFAIMSILVVAMINGVMTSYELTRNSNDRLETFYSADSGLEIAYNELISVVKNAIDEGYQKVESLKNDGPPIDANRNLINTSQVGWENKVFRAEYKAYLENNLEIAVDNVKHNSPIYDKFERDGKIIQVEANMQDVSKDEASTNNNAIQVKEQIGVNLKSTFENKDGRNREVEVDYDITIPDYGIKEIFAQRAGNPKIFSYIAAADGNMDMQLDTSLDIYGDIWVSGGELRDKKDSISNGILIADKGINSNIMWHGEVITNGTLEIQDCNFSTPKNNQKNYNVYAKNFKYTGNPRNKRYLFNTEMLSESNQVNNYGLNLHVYNDFIFNGTNTDMNIKSFYGLNDITDNNYLNPDEEPKVASSMIIESEDFGGVDTQTSGVARTSSNISIGNETAILGTAYLNIAQNPFEKNEFFKTGESVVINRHSSPYTYRGYTENEYLYKYKGKLHIIDKLYKSGSYNDLTIVDKVNIVKEFYNKNINLSDKDKIVGLGKGFKVNENKLLTAGVVYNDGKIIQGHNEKIESTIEAKRRKFSEEVYFMRDSSSSITEEDFRKGRTINTVGGSFNWDEIRKIVTSGDIVEGEEVIFKRDNDEQNLKNGGTIFKGVSSKTLVNNILNGEYIDGVNEAKVDVVLNYSDKDLVLRFDQEVPKEDRDENKIYINFDSLDMAGQKQYMNPTVVISKGDVIVERPKLPLMDNGGLQDGAMKLTSLIYTAGNLKYDIKETPSIVGNYFSEDTKLNRLFEAFFTNTQGAGRAFNGILGGKQSEEVEKVVNAEDLIRKGEWKLNK